MTRLSRGPVTAALPGLGLLVVVALCAHLESVAVPPTNRLLVAIFIGFVAANTVTTARIDLGRSIHMLLVEVGIVLMGVRLSLAVVVRTGPLLIALALVTISFGILLFECVEAGMEAVDAPDGLANVVTGSGSTVGDALLEHDAVEAISFTGSTNVDKYLADNSGMKQVTLELGGNDPTHRLGGHGHRGGRHESRRWRLLERRAGV